ncbi:MAG: DUF4041 domain-containing protein [Ruminococcus sp.]|nr:DUF4041 domain-containing protein [Ruminococcus sp.]
MGLFGPSKKELTAEMERLRAELPKEQQDFERLKQQSAALEAEIIARQQNIERQNNAILQLHDQIAKLQGTVYALKNQIIGLNEEVELQEYGVYHPVYEFANSDLYKDALMRVRQKQKEMIKAKTACLGSINWQVNGNSTQGRKMVADMQKLLLRAFNTECDNIIANVRISNREKSVERIHAICDSISKLGAIMSISIAHPYVELKIQELYLALDFAQKKAEEKERIRELKAQQREEAKAQKEIEEARKKLQKEQAHYQNAMKALLVQLENDPENQDLIAKKAELEANIADTKRAIEDVDYRDANKRAGYVYIISNIGAFGENVYKIGMTRRLEPMERIDELGDASVPFPFDVHALIFTEDAPALETALHNAFESMKLNKINHRREFFRVSLDEIKRVVRDNFDKTVEWIDIPPAEQFRQSTRI